MKRIKHISIILLALLIAFPLFGRPFGQEKNNFTGIQYFEAGVIFGSETDSLDTVTAVSNDPLMADADSAALVTEYAAKTYIDAENSTQDAVTALYKDTLDIARDSIAALDAQVLINQDSIALLEANKYESGDSATFAHVNATGDIVQSANKNTLLAGAESGYSLGVSNLIGGHYSGDIKANNSIIWGSGHTASSSGSCQYMAVFGQGHTITRGLHSFTAGRNNIIDASGSVVFGKEAYAKGLSEYVVYHSSGKITSVGDAQYERAVIKGKTTDATPLDINILEPANLFPEYSIADNSAVLIDLSIIASDQYGSVVGAYRRNFSMTNFDSTGIVLHNLDTIGTDVQIGGIGNIAIGVSSVYDQEYPTITVVGKAGTTIKWFGTIHATQTAF